MNDFDVVTGPAPGVLPSKIGAEAAKAEVPDDRRVPASPSSAPPREGESLKNERP